ncbi:D-serine ammonia-lyase [Mesorhizobium sp. M2E.F.Ca.ET.166.01.1.1]|nr:D-serine ammonia-lyase [Mesorhizobium sp. M2E.F.Ca.ET.219.01.1.1]TGT65570.1 D-serine ammonia-lyase [Mesorhizobium sp. M2E.F.Ca.ET.166.01.1.1]TGV97617.1 D-serine ammonia-lyase [Mesorhizobium sp. M2E.F.Ca.ET.154.01.1.1]
MFGFRKTTNSLVKNEERTMQEILPQFAGAGSSLTVVQDELNSLKAGYPMVWQNGRWRPFVEAVTHASITATDLEAAAASWKSYRAVLAALFPGEVPESGVVDSELADISSIAGRKNTFLKADHDLAIGSSIKARGGVFEVLQHADDRAAIDGIPFDPATPDWALLRSNLRTRRIVVGSTGNLAYSVARTAQALGFQAEVHISVDATPFKKGRLLELGVEVVEHSGDYRQAVAAARKSAAHDDAAYLIDDESSSRLFLGYSYGARLLADQLASRGISIDETRPLVVYLPCGVGGAPGGLTFGLKAIFGDNCACVFVEPTQSPCFLVQLMSGKNNPTSVYDIGLNNKTIADGLAVPSASLFAVAQVAEMVEACVTVADVDMLELSAKLGKHGYPVEPSAASALGALEPFTQACGEHLDERKRRFASASSTHVVWSTGKSTPDTLKLLSQVANQNRVGA